MMKNPYLEKSRWGFLFAEIIEKKAKTC